MRFLILGAGPAGLAFANTLVYKGIKDFIVLEKENEPGGLCRSVWKEDAPWDIGGGHFLDSRNKSVLDFIYTFMPEQEWNRYDRDSKIQLGDKMINSPIEANIWQLPVDAQVEYLKSIAIAGCNLNKPIPEEFVEWIEWKLGKKITEDYMLPYNKKMFGKQLVNLGTYWLDKLPNVSFEETLRSCLERKPYGRQPAHAIFLYPKECGYGEVWRRMAERLEDKIRYNTQIDSIDVTNHIINNTWHADYIVSTIPWISFRNMIGVPDNVTLDILELKYTSIVTEYINDQIETEAQWIYYPNEDIDYHRILVRKNFYPNAKGYWTETNLERYNKEIVDRDAYTNEFAYPLNTQKKPKIMEKLLRYMKQNNIYGLGRWGEWQHYNSDVVVERAITLANMLA